MLLLISLWWQQKQRHAVAYAEVSVFIRILNSRLIVYTKWLDSVTVLSTGFNTTLGAVSTGFPTNHHEVISWS